MSNFHFRRHTAGAELAAGCERHVETGAELHGDAQRSSIHGDAQNSSIHGLARSMRVAPAAGDSAHADYSQTPDSIRDRTMMLSSLALHGGLRDSIPSSRAGAAGQGLGPDPGGNQRGSFDSRSSIDQILAEAGAGAGNLSRLLGGRPASAVSAAAQGPPHADHDWLAAERVPKNARRLSGALDYPFGPLPEDGSAFVPPLPQKQQPHQQPQASGDAFPRDERDRLLPGQPSTVPPEWRAESRRARLQRRGRTVLGLLAAPLQYAPAVILGLILNLLDGLSYGLIAFPTSIPVFAGFGPVGFSMYMLSTAISQAVYSSGASAFRGANGTMLIEAIPFLYAICNKVVDSVDGSQPERVVATTMAAYAISTIITGVAFSVLGFLKIGVLVDFFPRHILVGCIGGVGYFLLQTGMEITSRVELDPSWAVLRRLFEPNALGLWTSSLALAILLRVLSARYTRPLFVPVFFMAVPAIFYLVTAALGLSLETLRATGWVFAMPNADVPFYHFYTLFDFGNTDWYAIAQTVPTMLGLAFFSLLHVPINVPALAVSTNVDKIDTNRELLAHGISNFASGCLGTLQNYLVYSNSVLFIRSGGGSNLAGMMLCVATLAIFLSGPAIIGYIPTMVVGALIFHLGLELLKEALVDTVGVVNRIEYATIMAIVLAMATLGFNEGIFLGILLACFFFILLYSRRSALRKTYTGSVVRSTVRRLYSQRRFLDNVCNQIQVVRLQGFMFFGTINGVEAYIRGLLEQRQWQVNPIRFLVLDFALVNGMDFSAAEAFIRIRRLLEAREIYMVICGAERVSEVGRALRAAGVWSSDSHEYVQTSPSLNESLEWCENVLLQYYYIHRAALAGTEVPRSYAIVTAPKPVEVADYGTSPRREMVSRATQSAMPDASGASSPLNHQHAVLPLLYQAFLDLESTEPIDGVLTFIAPYFVHRRLHPEQCLWHTGSPATGMYVVESGTLRVYVEGSGGGGPEAVESILPGTSLGELTFITDRSHCTTVVADGSVSLWELPKSAYDELCSSDPARTLAFVRLALMYSAQGMKAVTAYAFCAQ
ncbi:hypothetical protein LPJ61_004079 [Coemansia biformis]|uniref:Sulfate transporter family protein n=1 Tax=Coemansia biformis TaxID=1286918 RepID=A0A9W8CVP8_9FUNG|nr:hypothetical protein LPJ61_004079 [Coemansia biformis]